MLMMTIGKKVANLPMPRTEWLFRERSRPYRKWLFMVAGLARPDAFGVVPNLILAAQRTQ